MFKTRYIPTERFTYALLPNYVRWQYVESPPDLNLWGLPLSAHEHGVIAMSRPLGDEERAFAKLEIYHAAA